MGKDIEAALNDRTFIPYKAAWALVDGLQHVANRVRELIASELDRGLPAFLRRSFRHAHEGADEA